MAESSDILERLENLVIAASEGNKESLSGLLESITSVPVLPDNVIAFFAENIELVVEDPEKVSAGTTLADILLGLAERGVDAMVIRDSIACLARKTYSDYADPAGMIHAVGVLDDSVAISEVKQRYDMFGALKEGAVTWHDSYGFGIVKEIDPFGGQVYVNFTNRQTFGLDQALTHLSIARENSLAEQLYRKEGDFDKSQDPDSFDSDISTSFLPNLVSSRQVVEALLVPGFINHAAFLHWRDKSTAGNKHRKPVGASDKPVAAEPVDKNILPKLPDPADLICWENARSLQELKLELEKETKIELNDAHIEHFGKLYKYAAGRPKFAEDFARSLINLAEKCSNKDKLDELIRTIPQNAHIWQDDELFISISVTFKVKEMEKWLHVCLIACGEEWFIEHLTMLPLRFWTQGELILKANNLDISNLEEVAVKQFHRQNCTADVAVWLWKNQVQDAMPIFANPRVVFNVLEPKVVGEYIKARKALHDLIMSDEKFQGAMMDGGDLYGIENFVKTVRTTKAIELGERQSLLVKIVRQFPEAMPFVEEKKGRPSVRRMRKMSSYRSIALYQAELKDITNRQIPENAAAIGAARDYGDLRENFEFKAAKDQQRLLNARKKELETSLGEIVGTDFSDIEVEDIVIPGCMVDLDVEGETVSFYLCGLWDSEPERNIISYDTPLGKALMGKVIGDEIELPQGKTGTIKTLDKLPNEIIEWMQADA